jgi:hypothetical protein
MRILLHPGEALELNAAAREIRYRGGFIVGTNATMSIP